MNSRVLAWTKFFVSVQQLRKILNNKSDTYVLFEPIPIKNISLCCAAVSIQCVWKMFLEKSKYFQAKKKYRAAIYISRLSIYFS